MVLFQQLFHIQSNINRLSIQHNLWYNTKFYLQTYTHLWRSLLVVKLINYSILQILQHSKRYKQQFKATSIMAQNKKSIQEDIIKCSKSVSEAVMAALEWNTLEKYRAAQVKSTHYLQSIQKQTNNPFDVPSIFDKVPDLLLDESFQQKIANIKLTQFTQKRKDELFKRFRKDQQQRITSRKREVEKQLENKGNIFKLNRNQFTLKNEQADKSQTFPIVTADMEKLKPDTDLNDTIVGNYIKMFNFVFLPQHLQEKCYFYSSFFMEKLIAEYVKEEKVSDKESNWLINAVKEKVNETYKNLKRWTRKVDIFQKEIVVFPINAFRHWFTIILLRPYSLLMDKPGHKFEIIYCDSMFEKKEFIVAGIRKYLQFELFQKKGITIQLTEANAPCYQLLLPRQTNTHDCGLYMLTYIQELLSKRKELENLSHIKNRKKLNLFPRTLIYTMRQRLRRLFTKLINANTNEEKNEILARHKGQKDGILADAEPTDFDQINQRECRKYEKMNIAQISGSTEEERAFLCQIRFYLDPEINFYEKDK